jgi:hypothetical protein
MRNIVNEGSADVWEAKFYDPSDNAITPTTVHYRLRDLTNCRLIRDWTAVTAAQTVEIPITATENAIYSACTGQQENCLTVMANKDTALQRAVEERYVIRNLQGFS